MKLKPFLIMGILVMVVLTCATAYIKVVTPPESQIIKKKDDIQETIEVPIPLLIQQINENNAKIGNISCDIEVKIWQNGMRFKVSGDLHYEKHKRFRMKLSSVFGEEIDLGSNDDVFWYWSRRDKDPGLHWANYEDFGKTRLKTPFNPMFMKKSLSLDVIKTDDARIVETERDFIVVYAAKNGSDKPILVSVFVNKEMQRIDGMIVTNMDAKPVASAEIQEYQSGIPAKILYIWHEEGRALLLELKNPKINVSIPSDKWQMPEHKPKLNMAEDVFQSNAEPNVTKRVYFADATEQTDEKTETKPVTSSRSSNSSHSYRRFGGRRWRGAG
tara:strand:+ start:640 stop:1626 length:987 start_codon:yes stop_codon:yes gene_type:complete